MPLAEHRMTYSPCCDRRHAHARTVDMSSNSVSIALCVAMSTGPRDAAMKEMICNCHSSSATDAHAPPAWEGGVRACVMHRGCRQSGDERGRTCPRNVHQLCGAAQNAHVSDHGASSHSAGTCGCFAVPAPSLSTEDAASALTARHTGAAMTSPPLDSVDGTRAIARRKSR